MPLETQLCCSLRGPISLHLLTVSDTKQRCKQVKKGILQPADGTLDSNLKSLQLKVQGENPQLGHAHLLSLQKVDLGALAAHVLSVRRSRALPTAPVSALRACGSGCDGKA